MTLITIADTFDLLDLVEQLTAPHDVIVTDAGLRIGTRRQQPLLVKLRAAKTSNIGTGSGTSAAFGPKSTLDTNASELYTAIERRIRRWLIHTGYTRTAPTWDTPEQLLTAWYARVYLRPDLDQYASTLRHWVNAITELVVDPPYQWTIAAPCPACNQRRALDHSGRSVDALHAIEREPVHLSEITCWNCGATWTGLDGGEHLHQLIKEAS